MNTNWKKDIKEEVQKYNRETLGSWITSEFQIELESFIESLLRKQCKESEERE